VTLRLQRSNVQRSFRFEAPDGGFLDAAEAGAGRDLLQEGRVIGTATPSRRYLAGGKLIPGTYTAQFDRIEFSTLTVTEESPAEPIFRLPPAITYAGKVVDGVTGNRWRGAFVIGMNGTGEYGLSRLMLRRGAAARPAGPSKADDPALAPVHEAFTFELIARTDDPGRFEICSSPRWADVWAGLLREDRLPLLHPPVRHQARPSQSCGDQRRALFPAARVWVRPVLEPRILRAARPPSRRSGNWTRSVSRMVRRFRAAADGASSMQYDTWLKLNQHAGGVRPGRAVAALRLETPLQTTNGPRRNREDHQAGPRREPRTW